MTRLALVFLLAAPVLAAGAEKKSLQRLGKVWVDYARWCKLQGHKTEAEQALARARTADPDAKDLAALAADVDGLSGDKEASASLDARRRKAHKDAAKLLDRLAKAGSEPRHALYAIEAAALEPSRPRINKLAGAAKKAPTLIKAPDHAMVGYVTLPKGWKAGKEYPVLVAVDGAGSNFAGACRNFSNQRGSRRFIVLAPCSLSNTNQLNPKKYPFYPQALLDEHDRNRIAFDLKGLAALLRQAKEWFGAEESVGITGFSGGGNLCYGWTVVHPDKTRFSAPACANYSGMGFGDAQPAGEAKPPIRILTGENDPHKVWTHGKVGGVPGIDPQTEQAMSKLEELGYPFERVRLKGVGHSSCPKHVWDFCDEVAGK